MTEMYPYLELFGTKIYMTGIGIALASIVFLLSAYFLCKKYHQEFMKLFNWLPILLISVYFFGLYVSFVLSWGGIIPTSLKFLSPHGYHFNLVGILFASFVSVLIFLKQFRRNETKKIWIDILFFSFINAIIVLWVFLLLGDNFIGKQYAGALGVRAIIPESELIKYDGVYPIGIFLSLGALAINVIITLRKLAVKKVGLGLWGFIFLFILLLAILPFWNYPAHGVVRIFGQFALDINHYVLAFLIGYCVFSFKKLRKPF